MNDHELIREILTGDQQAIQQLHERYVDRIFQYIYIQTNSYHDTEELLQDVFFKVARQLGQFEGKSSFKTWIFKIARNVVIDYYRKQKKERQSISMDKDVIEHLGGKDESAEVTVLRHLHMDEILKTIDKLPSHYQAVLHLRFIEGFSTKETADIMGKSILSVKSTQRRARLALSERMNMEVSSHE
ncbi:RNA polymerase sigma factor [Halalkalibacter alkaliphilus]|uniref:RNA polymerase sigma factor n=1 Tax=Halalkalibacter alkaliphilus TaxID=2917993 RepID=A0A9X2A5R5_9BACI|nr:RNA polymerase sigma factor [Halalkalibacter alkaliphilus]MCL7745741.1 RNA polymerase sigma factor [Halalkalibacter alkaliphilus]